MKKIEGSRRTMTPINSWKSSTLDVTSPPTTHVASVDNMVAVAFSSPTMTTSCIRKMINMIKISDNSSDELICSTNPEVTNARMKTLNYPAAGMLKNPIDGKQGERLIPAAPRNPLAASAANKSKWVMYNSEPMFTNLRN